MKNNLAWIAGDWLPSDQRACLARSVLWLGLPTLLALGTAATAEEDIRRRAKAGDPTAQLALAVQLEATGSAHAPEAILWYARAAARGEARAQYYLGQIFETGQGVHRNPVLARAWYAAAAEQLAAAAGRFEAVAIPPPPDAPAKPIILAATFGETGENVMLDLVWTSPPQPDGARFYVDVRAEHDAGSVFTHLLERSAIAAPLPPGQKMCCVRVVALDLEGARYAASGWALLDPDTVPPSLDGAEIRILIRGLGTDRLAEDIVADLAVTGIIAAILPDPSGDSGAVSRVRYHYAEDGKVAEALVALLPGAVQAVRDPVNVEAPPPPGRVDVFLLGEAPVR